MTRDSAILMVWVMVMEPVLRGLDYIMGDGRNVTNSLSYVEEAAPLWFWGAVCLLAGLLVAFGLGRKVYEPVIVGSIMAFAVYMTLAVGLLMNVWQRGWPPDGFRTPAMFVAFGALWAIVALEMYAGRSVQKDAGSGDAGTGGTV